MKPWIAALLALWLGCMTLSASGVQKGNSQQATQPLPAADNGVQTLGKVGKSNYPWINGRAWLGLDDNAKVAMVAGIEQGIVLSVRENWDTVPKDAQGDLVKTAKQLTVNHFTLTQVAVNIDALYLQQANVGIPIVDAYEYAVLKLKQTPKKKLESFLKHVREVYDLPSPPKPGKKK